MSFYISKKYSTSINMDPGGVITGSAFIPSGYGYTVDNLDIVTVEDFTGAISLVFTDTFSGIYNRTYLLSYTGTSGQWTDLGYKRDKLDSVEIKSTIPITGYVYVRYGIEEESRN